jgi:hypothetical protein
MMTKEIKLTNNVAVITGAMQEFTNYIPEFNYGTVALAIATSKPYVGSIDLYGSWNVFGDEEENLENLYQSRLIISKNMSAE